MDQKKLLLTIKLEFYLKRVIPKICQKKLIELLNLDESTLNQMGIEGRKNIINKFNVEKMCFSTYSEYKKLINLNA